MTRLLAVLLLLTSVAEAQDPCDARQAATLTPQVSAQFRPLSLAGDWAIHVWVNGSGVPDTTIAGSLALRPRIPGASDSAAVRLIPLIGSSRLELEYVPGIEPFRTPVESTSDTFPGVELRLTDAGPTLVFGNPTVLTDDVIVLQPPVYAEFTLMSAFADAFAGRWELRGVGSRFVGGGFCAQRSR